MSNRTKKVIEIAKTIASSDDNKNSKLVKGAIALAMVTASVYAEAQENQNTNDTRQEIKTEPADSHKQDDKTINWKDAVDYYEKDGDVVPRIDGKVIFGAIDKSPQQELRKFNKRQKEDFKNAPSNSVDTISIVDTKNIERPRELAHYDKLGKFISTKFYGGIDQLTTKIEQLTDEKERRMLSRKIAILKDLNNPQSEFMQTNFAHEYNHMLVDKKGIYAPGLNSIQNANIYQNDEIAANLASLLLLEDNYKKALKAGKSQEEALKSFDSVKDGRFDFYVEALKNGLNPDSKEDDELKVKGTYSMWDKAFKRLYAQATILTGTECLSEENALSATIGDDKEYNRRRKEIFDSLGDNPYLKKRGIKVGKLSQYLPEKDLELLDFVRARIERETKNNTGLTTEEAREFSDKIPGDQKSDVQTLYRLFKKEIPKIEKTTPHPNSSLSPIVQNAIIHKMSR